MAMIGFMGAGKSTAARAAAQALGGEPVDIDHEVEQRLGKPIDRIFAEDGEAAFREAEERITVELLDAPGRPRVLGSSLGGGAITSAGVREALAGHLVVWIDVDPETAWARCHGTGRPLACDRDAFERLYRAREPIYRSLADAIVPHGAVHDRHRPRARGRGGNARRHAAAWGSEHLRVLPGVRRARGCWIPPASGRPW